MQAETGPEQPPAEGRRCASCGAPLEESFLHCPSCGQAVARAAPDFDIAAWTRAAWNLFINNAVLAAGIPLLMIVPAFALAFTGYFGFFGLMMLLDGHGSSAKVGLIALASFLGLMVMALALVMPALTGGIYACFLDGIRTGRLTAARLTTGFRHWWACTWVVWVLNAATLACLPFMFILIGIPVAIGLGTLGWLSLFRIVDKGQGGMEALSFAWGAMRGRFWVMLLVTLLAMAFMNAGAMAMYLGVLFTMPLGIAALAAAYEALRRKQEAPAAL
jgi:hypothetical protein